MNAGPTISEADLQNIPQSPQNDLQNIPETSIRSTLFLGDRPMVGKSASALPTEFTTDVLQILGAFSHTKTEVSGSFAKQTETPCVWRKGSLRRKIVGVNHWRPAPGRVSRKKRIGPNETDLREYWAPILCRPPWYKYASPQHVLKSRDCFGCQTFSRTVRAHIVARAYEDGSDHPSNLHLLCRMCHELSEGLSGLAYWRWFRRQWPGLAKS